MSVSPTIRTWLADWLARKRLNLRPQTWIAYEAQARPHVIPVIGHVRLDALLPEHIDKLHARLSRTLNGTTAHHVHMMLGAALADAERRGLVTTNAIRVVEAARRASKEIETLTRDEVAALLVAARGELFEAAYVLAVTLGVREGELLALSWQQIDLTNRRLVIKSNATRTLDGERRIAPPKTPASRRTLSLPQIAVEVLARTPQRSDLVWPAPNGGPLPASTFYKQWVALRRRAGIRRVTFHALRHTAATLAIEGGQPLQAVARMLGHSTVTTTMELYVHAIDASTEALADFIDFQYGPGLRVVNGAEWDSKGTPEPKVGAKSAKNDCRERDRNPFATCIRNSATQALPTVEAGRLMPGQYD